MTLLSRRKFLLGIGATAPVAITASNLMKIQALRDDILPPGIYTGKLVSVETVDAHKKILTFDLGGMMWTASAEL